MSLVFVSGSPGSGKSAITGELQSRGYIAYDTDDPNHTGLSGWYDLATDEYVAGYNELDLSEPGALESHLWKLTDEGLARLKRQSKEALVFACGALRQPAQLIDAAEITLWLAVNAATIRKRLAMPRDVGWGKEEWQVQQTIERDIKREKVFKAAGATMIDATQPLSEVVDQIITQSHL